MADSLVLNGQVELLGGQPFSTNPVCPNAQFRLQPGADPGAPQPTTDFVASLIMDGERPFGRRASNRTITLPIWITAPSRAILAAAREFLQTVIDQDKWTMTWTRDPGPGGTPLPLVFDCFRAQPSKPVFNTLIEKELTGLHLTVTIPALPYGRSDVQQQIAFASPVPASPAPPPSPVVLDQFTAIASGQCQQSTQCIVGPYTVMWDPDSFGDPGGQQTAFAYGATFSSPLNLAGLTALQMWAGFGTRYWWSLDYHHRTAGVSIACTLTDSSGNTLPFSRGNLTLAVSPAWGNPVFTRVTVPIPQGSGTFNYSSVASYALVITNRQHPVPRLGWVTCYLDHLAAIPPSTSVQPVTRGWVYTLAGLVGTARSPMSLSFQQPPGPGTPSVLTSAGAGSYTVPAGTAWLNVGAIGGGGAGASMTVSGVGGGGGGAEFAGESQFPASPGQVIPYIVGAGGTSGAAPVNGLASVFGPGPSSAMQVTANGGMSAAENSAAGGAGGSGSADSVEHPGGAGRAASGGLGGGGGSSAGPSSAGNYPAGTASITFTTSGSWLCPSGVTQVYAECQAGGGGGGCGSGNGPGAGGGGGEYRAAWIPVTAGMSYSYVVGSGGPGGSGTGGGGQNGSAGSLSSFTGDSGNDVIAGPGSGGAGGVWGRGGGGTGGSGGTGLIGYSGGKGGSAFPYSGGGGSSAGPAAAGNAGGSPSGAVAPPGGGAGGNGGGTGGGSGQAGTVPGGGGGGTYSSGHAAGAGAAGQVRLTYPAGTGAPTNAGGAAVPGGGAGGQGGATAGTAGSAGSAPGGGGGGANSGGTTVAGGAGGTGQITVTPYSSPAFRTLIVHRPPYGALKLFQPLVSVGGGSDTPNGSVQYQMPQPVAGVNASFGGTYTLYLISASWSGTGTRSITVTVTQYEYSGGPSASVSTIPVTVTPSQVTNGILCAGVLTLPVKAVPSDNTSAYYTVSVTDTNTSDRFYDLIFLDTQGQTVVINEPGSGYISYYIDAPDPDVSIGQVLGSWNGRSSAVSVMGQCQAISGGPMAVEPADADNILFAYSADGVAPAIGVSYAPRWYFDRFQ